MNWPKETQINPVFISKIDKIFKNLNKKKNQLSHKYFNKIL